MEQARHKRLYDLHSWTGLVLGLMIFLVSFTGCVALFYEEIRAWEDPAQRIELGAAEVPLDPLVRAYSEELDQHNQLLEFSVQYPERYAPYYVALAQIHPDEEGAPIEAVSRRWHPHNGEVLPAKAKGLSYWLREIHRRLMLPSTIGRSSVGIVGMALFLSLLTGIVIHLKFVKELFKWRMFRSVRLRWQDAHKVLGLWGLPFFTMISFTGAFLGIISLLSPVVALIAFKGDQDALIEAVIGKHPEPNGVQAQMVSLDELRAFRQPGNSSAPIMAILDNYGDTSAEFVLYFRDDKKLARFDLLKVDGTSGDILPETRDTEHSPATRVTDAVTALHYGTFGSFPLKVLYLLLGLGLCLVTALGMMLWVERRANGPEGKRSDKFYVRLGRFNSGAMLGIVPASVVPFYLDKLYVGAEPSRLFWTGACYLGVWVASIIVALFWRNPYQLTRGFLMASGLLLLGLPLVNGGVTGDWLFTGGMRFSGPSSIADLAFVVLGGALLAIGFKLPSARYERA